MSTRRQQKQQILAMLQELELEEVQDALDALPAKDVVNVLFSAICREPPRMKWHAVSCMGRAVARLADENLEEGRVVMRRFLWSLNDESGGIGWGAPESMAESMCNHRKLAEEYHHMLISYMRDDGPELCQDGNFLEHVFLQRGLLWGIGRLAGEYPELLQKSLTEEDLLTYLVSSDLEVRGLAVWAAGILKMDRLDQDVVQIKDLQQDFLLYHQGQLQKVTLQQLIDEFCQRIQ